MATPLYKLGWFSLFALAYCFFYLYPNFFPPFPPQYLPLLWIDQVVPFLPWTFIIYLSDYLHILLAVILVKDLLHFHSFCRLVFGCLILSGVVFLFFPTAYPRPPYPEITNPLIRFPMFLVGNLDQPLNCFPSLHVALTSAATWSIRHFGRKVFLVFFVWAMAIFISTLTTKQHYFVDVVGGFLVVCTVVVLDWLVFTKAWNLKRNLSR